MSYDDMLHLLNLPHLHASCRSQNLHYQWTLDFPQAIFFSQQPTYSSRRTSRFDFCSPPTQTDYYQTSYKAFCHLTVDELLEYICESFGMHCSISLPLFDIYSDYYGNNNKQKL